MYSKHVLNHLFNFVNSKQLFFLLEHLSRLSLIFLLTIHTAEKTKELIAEEEKKIADYEAEAQALCKYCEKLISQMLSGRVIYIQ